MPLHNPANWKTDDKINERIWRESPARQAELAHLYPVDAGGSVGGQQAMLGTGNQLGSPTNPLPWVPDLVGMDVNYKKGAIMIIGSAYAGFVREFSTRNFPRHDYINTVGLGYWAFQQRYLESVVMDDIRYYDKINDLLGDDDRIIKTIILSDWCRASYVRRLNGGLATPRRDKYGDRVCQSPILRFREYLRSNSEWSRCRIGAHARKLVLLGNFSHRCLVETCNILQWNVSYFELNNHEVEPPTTIGGFWGLGDQRAEIAVCGVVNINNRISKKFTVINHPASVISEADHTLWHQRFTTWSNE